MEKEKQYPKKERQANDEDNKNKELKITFHNPNTEEETAEFISRLILNNLEQLEWDTKEAKS